MKAILRFILFTLLLQPIIINGYADSGGLNNNKRNDRDLEPVRKIFLLDPGWNFHLGDASSPEGDFGFGLSQVFAKAGQTSGPGVAGF